MMALPVLCTWMVNQSLINRLVETHLDCTVIVSISG